MKTWQAAVLLSLSALPLGCDDDKTDKAPAAPSASAPAQAAPTPPPPPPAPAPPPPPAWKKRTADDCKSHPATIDFPDTVPGLEAEIRRKTGKDTAPLTPADLAQVKSLNLTTAHIHQIDPCIFPMFTSLKDLFLGPGEYDDIVPLQKLTTLQSLVLASSPLKDIHSIEGLKRLDRLDLSHTLIGDHELKSVAGLVNLTELMLDEDQVEDLTPVSGLKKLERLSIKRTPVKNLQPVANLRALRFLYIADAPISDITPVQPLVSGGMKLVQK